MGTLFDGSTWRPHTSMQIKAPAPMIFAMFLVVAERQGSTGAAFGDDQERHIKE